VFQESVGAQREGDWGRDKRLIAKNVKRKYLEACPPFLWRTGGPAQEFKNQVATLFFTVCSPRLMLQA